jgi:hypothetical protein
MLLGLLFLVTALGLGARPADAQQPSELEALKQDMEVVKKDLAEIKKALSEMRQLLVQRPAPPGAAPATIARVSVGSSPILGNLTRRSL